VAWVDAEVVDGGVGVHARSSSRPASLGRRQAGGGFVEGGGVLVDWLVVHQLVRHYLLRVSVLAFATHGCLS
jgi:hypothetical protein